MTIDSAYRFLRSLCENESLSKRNADADVKERNQ